MTNHVHLLITPERSDAVPRVIIALGRRYVQYINTIYRLTGTLWDSRYKSSLTQAETYLLACQRYIELNPVRAAMVDPCHYRWTSYRRERCENRHRLRRAIDLHRLHLHGAASRKIRRRLYTKNLPSRCDDAS